MKNQLVVILVTAIVGAALGFGASQATLANTTVQTSTEVKALGKLLEMETQARKWGDDDVAQQLMAIRELEQKQMEQNSQLISLLKIQNQLK